MKPVSNRLAAISTARRKHPAAAGRRSGRSGLRLDQAGLSGLPNVDPVKEITDLITAQRACEMNSRLFRPPTKWRRPYRRTCVDGEGDGPCEGDFQTARLALAGGFLLAAMAGAGAAEPHCFCRAFGDRLSRTNRERYRASGKPVLHQCACGDSICAVAGSGGRRVARKTPLPGKPILVSALGEPSLVTRGIPAPLVFTAGTLTTNCDGYTARIRCGWRFHQGS